MSPEEMEQRAAVVAEARSWVGTPYHHMGEVKGAGCDCAQLIKHAFLGAGVVLDFEVERYTSDWHLHRSEEKYLSKVEEYCGETHPGEVPLELRMKDPGFRPLPGDIIMFRIGRTYSHGCVVTEWPMVVHANLPSGRVEEISVLGTPVSRRVSRVYSYWKK